MAHEAGDKIDQKLTKFWKCIAKETSSLPLTHWAFKQPLGSQIYNDMKTVVNKTKQNKTKQNTTQPRKEHTPKFTADEAIQIMDKIEHLRW